MTTTTDDQQYKVIVPPPEVKKIADFTCDTIAKNPAFEELLRIKHQNDPRFTFMQQTSPYYGYFRARIKYGENIPELATSDMPAPPPPSTTPSTSKETVSASASSSSTTAIASPASSPTSSSADSAQASSTTTKKLSLHDRLRQRIMERTYPAPRESETEGLPLPAPGALQSIYSIKPPRVHHPWDLDVVKLVALFVARNGRNFLSGLQTREGRNPQFDFLKPTHPLFPSFQAHIEAYSNIVVQPKDLVSKYKEELSSVEELMKDLTLRAKYKLREIIQKEQQSATDEQERVAMQLIDWHSFVVAGTVTFSRDEDPYLPAPHKTIEEIENALAMAEHYAAEANKAAEAAANAAATADAREMGMGDVDGVTTSSTTYPSTLGSITSTTVGSMGKPVRTGTGVSAEDEPLRIRTKAEIEAEAAAAAESKRKRSDLTMQKCPICGEMVPLDQLQAHIDIELLDPNWREQKKVLEDRKRDAAQAAATLNIAGTVARIAAHTRADAAIAEEEGPKLKWGDVLAQTRTSAAGAAAGAAGAAPGTAAGMATAASIGPSVSSSSIITAPTGTSGLIRPPTISSISSNSSSISSSAPSLDQAARLQAQMLARSTAIAGGGAPPPPPPPPVSAPSTASTVLKVPFGAGTVAASTSSITLPMARPGPTLSFPMGASTSSTIPAASSSEPGVKRARTEDVGAAAAGAAGGEGGAAAAGSGLVSESQWLATHDGAGTVTVSVPDSQDTKEGVEFGFDGRKLEISFTNLSETVGALKSKIGAQLNNMPPNKMKVNVQGGVFLNKDALTLAYYNIKNGDVLDVGFRVRGGKK